MAGSGQGGRESEIVNKPDKQKGIWIKNFKTLWKLFKIDSRIWSRCSGKKPIQSDPDVTTKIGSLNRFLKLQVNQGKEIGLEGKVEYAMTMEELDDNNGVVNNVG